MSNPFQEDALTAPTIDAPILVEINARMIPLVLRALDRYKSPKSWVSDNDFQSGVQQINILQEALLAGVQTIVDSVDRLYRLLDTSLNGTAYSATPATSPPPAAPADPTRPTFTPALPVVPPATSPAVMPMFALRARFERVVNLLDNLATGQQFPAVPAFLSSDALQNNVGLREKLTEMQGVVNAGWFGIGGQEATLADVVTALRLGSAEDKTKVLTALDAIIGASSSATIFNTVRELFTESADLGLEGAQFVVLLVATMSQIVSNTFVGQQLDRIIRSLDGGGFIPPGDSVLEALRGDDQADAERNAASLLAELRELLKP